MTIARLVLVWSVLAAAVVPVHAQTVEAEVLFREGKKLIKDGKIAAGCDKLDASARLESSVGTLLNLADCREKNGQLATAWATFHKAAAAAKVSKDDQRHAEALRREKLLEPKLSYLTISIADENRVTGLAIARNGAPVDPALWNASVPVDGGDYEIVGEAPARERWSKRIHVDGAGQHASVEVPKLAATAAKPVPDTPAPEKPAAPRSGEVGKPSDDDETRDAAPSVFTPTRKIALAVGGAGLIGVAMGVYFGVHAKNLEKQSDALCPTTACTDPKGVSLNADARSAGTTATIALAAGGVAIGAGAVMWFLGAPRTAREHVAVTPTLDGNRVGFAVTGGF